MLRLPIIGVTACTKQVGLHPNHIVGDKYVRAVAVGAEALPLVIPALGELIDHDTLLAIVDGLLFTGSPSNVEPHHYSGPASMPGTHHDIFRDATTLPLIRKAIDAGIPVLGICRGFQEMNVAFGGSLHQRVQEVAGMMDHREPADQPVEVQYAPPPHRACAGGWGARRPRLAGRDSSQFHSWPGRSASGAGPSRRSTGA